MAAESPEKQTLAEGRFVRLVKRGRWEWAERTNARAAVVIVPVTEAGELVLIEQYRVPLGRPVIELPAGLAGDTAGSEHEELVEAARRELVEETGYEAGTWRYLTEGPSSAGLATEVYCMFLAEGCRKTGPGGGDEREEIHVHVVPLDEVHRWIEARCREGMMIDPKIFAGLYFVGRTAPLLP